MIPKAPPSPLLTLALVGSLLMFAGWVLTIVPTFQQLQSVWLVVVVALVGFGLVLIPSGLDIFWIPLGSSQKRGLGVLLVSLLPAAALFLLTVFLLPIGLLFRVLAIIAEFLGMGADGWTWWKLSGGRRPPGDEQGR